MIAEQQLNEFYVTLPSNSSARYYGKQAPSSYKTKLIVPVDVDPGQWTVGLSQIVYPRSWANIKNARFKVTMPVDGTPGQPMYTEEFTLSNDRFENAAHLIADLDEKIHHKVRNQSWSEKIHVLLERYTKRCVVKMSTEFILELPEHMAVPLGFGRAKKVLLAAGTSKALAYAMSTDRTRVFIGEVIKSPHTVNADRLITELYLYTSIISQQRVGDTLAPLLRTITDVGSGSNETVVTEFKHIHYHPLQTGYFEEVEVHLADSSGTVIDFSYGDVVVTLHFRKR